MSERNFWESSAGSMLRWMGFAPTGLLGGLLVNIAAMFLYKAFAWLSGMPPWAPWITIVSAGIGGWAGVQIGTFVAPHKGRRPASIVLATLISLIGVAAVVTNFIDRHWALLLGALAMSIAAIVTSVNIHQELVA